MKVWGCGNARLWLLSSANAVEGHGLGEAGVRGYRGTSLVRNRHPVGSYSSSVPRALWWSYGGGCVFL